VRLALAAVFALAACAPPRFVALDTTLATTSPATTIDRVELKWSSVYLVRRGTAAFLVDSGSPPDRDDLYAALAARGVYARDLGAVILTHGHADHAGCARWLQLSGAPIVLGAATSPWPPPVTTIRCTPPAWSRRRCSRCSSFTTIRSRPTSWSTPRSTWRRSAFPTRRSSRCPATPPARWWSASAPTRRWSAT